MLVFVGGGEIESRETFFEYCGDFDFLREDLDGLAREYVGDGERFDFLDFLGLHWEGKQHF